MNSLALGQRGGGPARPAHAEAKSRWPPTNPCWQDALAALAMAVGWAGWGLLLLMAK
mgnify:CR=1 FL=1